MTGALVPLLTLGIPTSATAAVLLSAFQNYGIQPGPLLFQMQGDLVWGLLASLYIGNVLLLILNLPLVGMWVKVLMIPRPLLYGGILVFATLGAYSLHQSVVDLMILYIFGLLGFCHAPLGHSGRAGCDRLDPRSARRNPSAPRARDQPGQCCSVCHSADLGGDSGRLVPAADRAADRETRPSTLILS